MPSQQSTPRPIPQLQAKPNILANQDKPTQLTLRDIQVIHGCRINDKLELCFILEILNNKGTKVEVPKHSVSPETLNSNAFIKFYATPPFNAKSIQELEHKLINNIKQQRKTINNDNASNIADDLMLNHTKIIRKRNPRKYPRYHIAFKQCPLFTATTKPSLRPKTPITISETPPIICGIKRKRSTDSVRSKIEYVQSQVKQKRKKRKRETKEHTAVPISSLTSLIPRKPPKTFRKEYIEEIENKKKDISSALSRIQPTKPPINNRKRVECSLKPFTRNILMDDSSSSSSSDIDIIGIIGRKRLRSNDEGNRPNKRAKMIALKRREININQYEMNCEQIFKESDQILDDYRTRTMREFENDMNQIQILFK